ncbi:type II toxin-antitoxin system ParD family antitoxin [uncultured Roseivirga sp.]|uniref:type II toxin-antitoxin system ParD family antitoxin n=1 Tax=uncultured Roseivirga sp. TaxID=543088 RepID=UPI0030DA885E|tara:strand:+ start:114761 stop:114982 length:222 start_codon:yes stop_codon:yes gene_type:complete
MNVSLTDKQEKYIASQIESGDYQNASELVRDALRLHQVYRNKVLNDLLVEIEKGWEASVSNRSVQDIIKAKTQ